MDIALESLVRAALEEDIGAGDLTTTSTVDAHARCRVRLVAKAAGVLSGMHPFRLAFELLQANVEHWEARHDGDRLDSGDIAAAFTGKTRAVLTAERTALNFLQHLSGVATETARYTAALTGLPCKICDTRKTTPLFRHLEKAAVLHGGGMNHRHRLDSGMLIKENHITAAGGIAPAVARARQRAHLLQRVEVEVTNLDEFEQALATGADVIMLDNMPLEMMAEAARRAKSHKVLLEASGNATLDRVRAMAETGVDFISVGALTHSAPALDFSLLIETC